MFQIRDDLIRQAELLGELPADIDPSTVGKVQAAIAYDIAFFEMVCNQETRRQLFKQYITGEIDIQTGTIEAAQMLVNLMLGEP